MAPRRTLRKLDPDELWEYALRVLSQRAHSISEVKQKLSRRSQTPQALTAVLAKLKEYGLADDKRFSETFAESRLSSQGFGKFRVLRDLRSKRVANSVAQQAVEKVFVDTDEKTLIQRFLNRKYRNQNLHDYLKDPKHVASAYRRLRLAGFSGSGTLSVLKQYSREIEDFETPEDGEESE
jgi:regulatory protein